jgi:dihydrodipicolinate synthase/N-acetylneuraminate lyase
MKHAPLPCPLRGIIPPLATPLLDQDRLDPAGLERLIEHTLAGGVHGLFMLGSTGEGPSLSARLRREIVERTCQQVAGRVPVLVGITDAAFGEAVAMAEHAAGAGAAAVVHAGPYYFPIAQLELAHATEALAAAVPVPLFLYNMPSHTKIHFELETVRRLVHAPNIAGIKDSSGQLVYFKKLVQLASARPDFAVLIGPEELLAEAIFMGAHGGITGGANLDPALFVKLYEAARSGDIAKCREPSARALRISLTLYATGTAWSSYLHGIKVALKCMGICGDAVAEPFEACGSGQRALIERHVRELGLVCAHRGIG